MVWTGRIWCKYGMIMLCRRHADDINIKAAEGSNPPPPPIQHHHDVAIQLNLSEDMNKVCIMNGAAAATAPANAHAHDEVEVDNVGKLLATAKLSHGKNNANVTSSASREDVPSNHDHHHHHCHQRAAQQQQAITNNEFAAEHRIYQYGWSRLCCILQPLLCALPPPS